MEPIDPTLKAAIENYFAKKYHDGTGGFKDGEKKPALDQVGEACKALGFGWEIVPGLVCIHMGEKGSLWFDRHNKETGTLMTSDTKNPWRKMDEGRTKKSYELFADRLDVLESIP